MGWLDRFRGDDNKELLGVIALVLAALFWGGEYVVEKDVLSVIEPNWSNTIRFLISGFICVLMWRKDFRKATLADWKNGMLCGILMGLGFAFQTMGLELINAGINAVLCTAYLLVIPFLVWAVEKNAPNRYAFISAIIGICGIVLMSVDSLSPDELGLGKGETITLLGAFFYAGGIVSVDYCSKKTDTVLLTGIQCIATFLVALFMALIFEEPPSVVNPKVVVEFVYLIIFSSLLAQLFFNYGMKYVESGKAGAIFLLETVFAVILGCLILHENILAAQILGTVLILGAIFFSGKKTNKESNTLKG